MLLLAVTALVGKAPKEIAAEADETSGEKDVFLFDI